VFNVIKMKCRCTVCMYSRLFDAIDYRTADDAITTAAFEGKLYDR
jgi:hypothetical protein